jgi:hypothetical protein
VFIGRFRKGRAMTMIRTAGFIPSRPAAERAECADVRAAGPPGAPSPGTLEQDEVVPVDQLGLVDVA